jgi:cytidylate kinase
MHVIAIDGPAGSGKSTVAKRVASRLDIPYLDTGAMYRSVAFAVVQRGIDPDDKEAVVELARDLEIEVDEFVLVDGVDATVEIRGPVVTQVVSSVASNQGVRDELVRRQREWGMARKNAVLEGRDIGRVVFPDAILKVYLTADEQERARRRAAEQGNHDHQVVASDISRRDYADRKQMGIAEDAIIIDSSTMAIDDVVDMVLSLWQQRIDKEENDKQKA